MKQVEFHKLSRFAAFYCLLAFIQACSPDANSTQDISDQLPENKVHLPGSFGEPLPKEDPTSVDIGNPTDTGPVTPAPKSKIYIADAAPADGAQAVHVTIIGLMLKGSGETPNYSKNLPPERVNLMEFSEGLKHLLLDEPIPPGEYHELVIQLSADEEATITDQHGVENPIYLAERNAWELEIPASQQGAELYGDINLVILPDASIDITMHVDLRYAIRPMSVLMAGILGPSASSYDYWMVPRNDTFVSDTVGNIILLGLEDILATVVCIYPSDYPGLILPDLGGLGGVLGGILGDLPLLDLQTGDDNCYDAEASAAKKNGEFYLGYLNPGEYRVRLFLGENVFVDLPPVLNVTSGLTGEVDLSDILDILP